MGQYWHDDLMADAIVESGEAARFRPISSPPFFLFQQEKSYVSIIIILNRGSPKRSHHFVYMFISINPLRAAWHDLLYKREQLWAVVLES